MKTSNQTAIGAHLDEVLRDASGVLDRPAARNRDEGLSLSLEE